MTFLSLVIVLLLVQWWGSGKPLQRDQWFFTWWRWLESSLAPMPGLWRAVVAVAVPGVALAIVLGFLIHQNLSWWILLINVPVLLFSLGRGPFTDSLNRYIEAAHADNSVRAAQTVDEMNLDPGLRKERDADDWVGLHREALRVFSYRGFERMFSVIFWFLLAGAPGAIAYRLTVLLWSHWLECNDARARCFGQALAWMEWPASRLLGITWALVGNFESCLRPWRQYCWQMVSTPVFLSEAMLGALGDVAGSSASDVNVTGATRVEPAYSLHLVEQLPAMFSRALLLWVFAAAVIALIL